MHCVLSIFAAALVRIATDSLSDTHTPSLESGIVQVIHSKSQCPSPLPLPLHLSSPPLPSGSTLQGTPLFLPSDSSILLLPSLYGLEPLVIHFPRPLSAKLSSLGVPFAQRDGSSFLVPLSVPCFVTTTWHRPSLHPYAWLLPGGNFQ